MNFIFVVVDVDVVVASVVVVDVVVLAADFLLVIITRNNCPPAQAADCLSACLSTRKGQTLQVHLVNVERQGFSTHNL
jgi:hypothetical protein